MTLRQIIANLESVNGMKLERSTADILLRTMRPQDVKLTLKKMVKDGMILDPKNLLS
jgi:hypothetical protein